MRYFQLAGICFFLSLLALSCKPKYDKANMVTVDKGVELPIDACVEANAKIFGNSVDVPAFCKCLLPKLYAKYKDDPHKFKLLREGRFDQLAEAGVAEVTGFYDACMTLSMKDSTTRITITPRMAERIKQGIKDSFAGTGFEETNDIEAYCDCIISGMQTDLSAKEIMQQNAADSLKFQRIQEKCVEATRKK